VCSSDLTKFPGGPNTIDVGFLQIIPNTHFVIFGVPVPVIGNVVTLMTLRFYSDMTTQYEFYLNSVQFSVNGVSVDLFLMDSEDPGHGSSVVHAYPSSGSFDEPVFSINSPGAVVAAENESWGGVKALFR